VSAEEIFRDRKILKREAFLNLSRSSYLFSKIAILFLLSAIQTITFVLIANGILQIRGMYVDYWLILFSTALFANMLGLNISATFNSAVTIYIVIPLLMIPMMVLSGAMFSFEKLNRAVGSINRVPLVAEFMVTKWGYEALVVHQFKDNDFQKVFFDIEKVQRNADFKVVHYIPELEKRVNLCLELIAERTSPEVKGKFDDALAVVRRAVITETTVHSKAVPYNYTDRLTPDKFDEEAAYALVDYVDALKRYYNEIFLDQSQKRERIVQYLVSTNPKLYEGKRRAYHNESISDLATKFTEKNKILQYKDELVQQNDPVFRDPLPNHLLDFRSHFLAPRKHFLGMYFDTFWFNLSAIWIMTILLYVTLYYESLKKLIELFSKIKLPSLSK